MDKAGRKRAKLRMLARLDADAMAAYDAAIARVDVESVKTKLTEFRLDHARHIQDLNALLVAVDGEQVTQEPDPFGSVLKAVTSATGALGTEAALVAMMGNEGLTNATYEVALRADWTDAERAVIQKNREDEKRHILWLKDALLARVWTRGRETEAHP